MEGLEINVKVGDKLMGVVELTEDYMVLEIKEDNTFTMTAMGEKGESGTWKQDGGKVVLTVDGEDMTVDLSGSSITFEQEGMKIVLKK